MATTSQINLYLCCGPRSRISFLYIVHQRFTPPPLLGVPRSPACSAVQCNLASGMLRLIYPTIPRRLRRQGHVRAPHLICPSTHPSAARPAQGRAPTVVCPASHAHVGSAASFDCLRFIDSQGSPVLLCRPRRRAQRGRRHDAVPGRNGARHSCQGRAPSTNTNSAPRLAVR